MAPPNNPLIARLTVKFARDTREFQNTFHLYRSLGWTYANLQNACEGAYTVWSGNARPYIPGEIALKQIHGQVYDPDGSPWVYDRNVSPVEPGLRAGTAEAGNVTLAISERANLAGRAYRGRIYWPGFAEGDVNTIDVVGSGILAGLGVFAQAWLTQFNDPTGLGKLALFHRDDNLFTPVSVVVLENVLDSQRRRLPKRGV